MPLNPAVLEKVREFQERLALQKEVWRAENWEKWLVAKRKRDRDEYADARGGVVRPYEHHEHQEPIGYESSEERSARMHRDRQRSYRNVDEITVREYTDLSSYSPEQKVVHRRELARLRKARSRERAREVHVPLTDEEKAALEAALSELVV